MKNHKAKTKILNYINHIRAKTKISNLQTKNLKIIIIKMSKKVTNLKIAVK
jgi:hypothetical protein